MRQYILQLFALNDQKYNKVNVLLLSLLLVFSLILTAVPSAYSLTFIPFTGRFAYGANSTYYPSDTFNPCISGFNNHYDAFGTAAQFVIESNTYLSKIDFAVELFNHMDPTQQANTDFKFMIYQGNGLLYGEPDFVPGYNRIYESQSIFLKMDLKTSDGGAGGVPTYYESENFYDLTSSVDLYFSPGIYWLAAEGGDISSGTKFLSIDLLGTPVPEPSTALLFVSGFVGVVIIIRKSLAGVA